MGGDELSIQRPDDIDYLSLYRGKPCIINDDIRINVPTLDEICDYNDTKYFGMVHTLCSVGVELCWQLDEIGIDFEEVSDYRLFYSMLAKNYNNEQTRILFGDHLDFSKMKLYMNKDDESISMVQQYLVSVPFMSEYGEEMTQIPYGDKVILIEQGENVSKIKYNDNIGYVMSIYLSENENGKSWSTMMRVLLKEMIHYRNGLPRGEECSKEKINELISKKVVSKYEKA